MALRVAVFIDYQNVVMTAREAFPFATASRHWTDIDPVKLGNLLVSRRIGGESVLSAVRVYRGRPSPNRQPTLASINDAQADAWSRDRRVTVVRKMLRYPKTAAFQPPQEKGIDVALAVDFISLAYQRAYDVGIIASHDTDLLPALERVVELRLAIAESAAWQGHCRLYASGERSNWCHVMRESDFRTVMDLRNYRRS